MKSTFFIKLATAILFIANLAACGQSETTAKDEQSLVIYSGRSDKFMQPVVQAFTAQTGIKVTLHSGKSAQLLSRLEMEGDTSPADVFVSNDAGNLAVGAQQGLFQAINAELLQNVDLSNRGTGNYWTGVSGRARVIVANKRRLQAEGLSFIKSVEDLADPRLKGKLAITSASNGSFVAGVSVYLQQWGNERVLTWLKGLKSNAQGEAYAKHSKVVSDVAAGNKAVGLVNHYYILRHLAKKPDADLVMIVPDQTADASGLAVNVAGAAIVKPSANANAFIEFVLSNRGQEIFSHINNELPVVSGIPFTEQLKAVLPQGGKIKVADVSMQSLGELRSVTIDMINAAQLP